MVTITITGTNDAAHITVGENEGDTDLGTVTEDGNSDNDASTVQAVSGKLDISDADEGQAVFQVQSNVTDGNYGRFSIDAAGNWNYTLNNAHPDVQALKAGETLTRELIVTSADGSDSHKVVITIVGANEAPVAQDFMIKPLSDHGVLINFNNPGGDGGDKISDEEDDTASSGNAALKVIITVLPEAGNLVYTDLNGVSRPITQDDVKSKSQFEADRISYQPTDGLGFLLGSKGVPDSSLKEGGFFNWGVQKDTEGKVREVTFANGDVITISSDSGPLKQYQEEATHVGHGIGDNDGSGIEEGERISINFVSEPAHDIKVGLDGLGGLFESGDSGAALITVTYSNQTSETFYVRKDSGVIGDDGLFKEWSHTPPGNLTITQLTFSTEGDGNWELRYVESLPKDETFKYQTIDSEGLLSNEATVIVNNSNADRTPVAEDGHIVTNEDQSYVFKWSDFGVTDVDTLPLSLSVIIDSLPLDGSLKLNGAAIEAGTSVSYEDIKAGKLVFTPDTHESSTNNASEDGANVGNKEADYAKFDFKVSDGVSTSHVHTVVVDVTPVADGVTVTASFSLIDQNSTTHPAQAILDSVAKRLSDHAGDFVKYTFAAETAQSDYFLTGSLYNTYGGSGNDVLVHSEGTQIYLDGGTGNDVLIGSDGTTKVTSEQLYGGHGSDILIGGASVDGTIDLYGDNTGEVGDDVLISRNANNTTSFYGGEGRDLAYLPVAFTDFNVFSGDGHPYDVRLQLKGSSAFQDFYSVEFVYFTDGKYQIVDGSFTKISEFVELNIEASLIDVDGSEEFTDIIITGLPVGTVIPGSQYNEQDGSFTVQVPTGSIDATGTSASIKLPVELPVNTHLGQVTIKVGSQEIDSEGQPIGDVVYGETQTGFVGKETNPNGNNTVEGGKGDDVLLGDVGGYVVSVQPGVNYNIALIIDTSGSMKFDLAGNDNGFSNNEQSAEQYNVSRMKLVIDAITSLANDLVNHDGVININLIDFESSANSALTLQLTTANLQQLIDKIQDMEADGGTNYEAAFDLASDWFSEQPTEGYENLTYFLTDGDPTFSNRGDNGSGNTTDYWDMYDAIDAFKDLSGKSTVHAIGIGDGITESRLKFFDNTNTGLIEQVDDIYTEATLFSFSTWTGSSFGRDGNVSISDGALVLADSDTYRDNGYAQWISEAFNVEQGQKLSFDATLEAGTFSWALYNANGELVTSGGDEKTKGNKSVNVESDALQAGIYKLVISYDATNERSGKVKIDEINLLTPILAPAGEVQIVTTPEQLEAALQSGDIVYNIADVGSDTVIGNEGNDILFGDAINTDSLPWGINGNPEKPEGIVDGAGLKGLETFLELKYGSAPSELDIYKFIKDNHDLFDVDGDTRGGNDTLDGGVGDDILYGQGGNDILIGGLGDDILTGGEGADIFKFVDQGTGLRDGERDTITDFTAGQDKIDLSDLLHTDLDDSIESLLARDEIGLAINGGHLELTISDGSSNQTVVIEDGVSQYQSYITEGSITNMNAILNDLLKIHDN
ncbi:VCBS domain-containing protein [Vibrio vulnificus]|uniref:VCBS domain-containing protein n=1 Tax=Vibrio vulnificus TaxID=672 RepID=UPI0039B4B936